MIIMIIKKLIKINKQIQELNNEIKDEKKSICIYKKLYKKLNKREIKNIENKCDIQEMEKYFKNIDKEKEWNEIIKECEIII